MGKSRRWNRYQRPHPASVPGGQNFRGFEKDGPERPSSSSVESSQYVALGLAITKLMSSISGERECGAEALAMVANNKGAIQDLLDRNIVRIAAPLLLDSSPTVRHSIAGSFRNITAVGGPEVCEHFVEKDVLTSVVHLYQKFYHNWRPGLPKEGKIDSCTEIFIETTNLLWNLCESSEQAVSIFNKHNLLAILLPCLNVSVFGPRVSVVTAQCLQAVTENNADLLLNFPAEKFISSVRELLLLDGSLPSDHHLRTLAAGIILNLYGGKLTSCTAEDSSSILEALSKTLSININETIKTFKEKNDELIEADRPEEQSEKADKEQLAREDVMSTLCAKEEALEVLTNICCNDDGADEWESLCSSEAGDDMETPMEEDSDNNAATSLPAEIQDFIGKLKLVPQVEEHAFIPDDVQAQIPATKDISEVQEKLEATQCCAFLCLHNLVAGGVQLDETPGSEHLHQLWIRMAKVVLSTAAKGQGDLLEATSDCLRAIIQRLADEKNVSSVVHLTLDDLNALYKVAQDCPQTKIRVNVLRVVATVGVLLQLEFSPKLEPLIASIGEFLLHLGLKDEDVWVNAEAADAIMEVFAEDHLDVVSQQISLVEKCKEMNGILKTKARQLQKQRGENLPVVALAKTNLSRFIKYKSKLLTNGQG